MAVADWDMKHPEVLNDLTGKVSRRSVLDYLSVQIKKIMSAFEKNKYRHSHNCGTLSVGGHFWYP